MFIAVSMWVSINAQEFPTKIDGGKYRTSPFRAAVTMGFSFSHPKDFESFLGHEIGIKGEYAFSRNENFYLSTALSFTNKGWNLHIYTMDDVAHVWDWDIHYLELPLFAGYKFRLSSSSNLFLELGPYFAFGFLGNSRLDTGEESFHTKNIFLEDCRRVDWGTRTNAGLNINQWQYSVGYSHGFINPSKIKMISPQRNFFHMNVAYFF